MIGSSIGRSIGEPIGFDIVIDWIVSRDILTDTVDCVLAGDQNWERTWRIEEINTDVKEKTRIRAAGRLNDGQSSFTSKTGRGYD